MDPVTLSHPEDDGTLSGPRTVRNRKYSLYASRVKPLDLEQANGITTKSPPLPDMPSLPVSPRWDSLSHGSHLLNQPGASSPSKPSQDTLPPLDSSQVQSALTNPDTNGVMSPPNFTSPGSIIANTPDRRTESPTRSLTAKSSFADVRSPDSTTSVENFSRPRKQSIRRNGPPEGLGFDVGLDFHLEPTLSNLASIPQPGPPPPAPDRMYDLSSSSPQTPPWQRHRRPSTSSVKSSSAFGSPMHNQPGMGDYREPRSYRARNVTGPPAISTTRMPHYSGRADSAASTPFASPNYYHGGAAAPWVSGDELRSSFRSQLTASTTPGTAVTERSSVLTKESSVTSLENPDEPSLEDVMCMYEKGFADDEDENDSDYYDQESNGNFDSRPVTAVSEPEMHRFKASSPIITKPTTPLMTTMTIEPDDHLAPPLPNPRSALDAEIRQSRMIFSSPAFTSSVAAIAGKAEVDNLEKRHSAKSLDSEPSVSSKEAKTPLVSPPSTSSIPSRSPSPIRQPAGIKVEPEDPGSRDRYGFKKTSQSISREQYDAWNKDYSQYLARRRRKWVSYLKDCALMTDRPNRFPAPCAKTKRFVRKGIPPDWRGAAWFYYAGGPAILAKHSGLYEKLLLKKAKQVDIEAIERDLHRTFPDNIQFKPSAGFDSTTTSSERSSQSTMTGSSDDGVPGPRAAQGEPPIITSLRRVLHAFSIYNPRIGYCQSLNFLAGLLLLFVETEEQCFWLLNVITIIYLPGTHEMSLEGSKVDLGVLMTELRDQMPSVWEKIGGELENLPTSRPSTSKSIRKPRPILRRKEQPGLSTERLPPITLCMTAWFMSCYIGTLPIETTLRVWDVFFYEGSKTLFRMALAIFKSGENEIKAVKDPMEMFGVVQAIPRRMLDANALMESCFKRRNGFGHISQAAIDDRRQERREKARLERVKTLQRQKDALSGNVTEVETETISRRGTLFGKKRPSKPVPA